MPNYDDSDPLDILVRVAGWALKFSLGAALTFWWGGVIVGLLRRLAS